MDEWLHALDVAAGELLGLAGITAPPVDAFRMAEELQVSVVCDRTQSVRGRHKTLNGRSLVFLRPDQRPERVQWALAHEIGEVTAWRVAELVDADSLTPGFREEIANHLASRILLPSAWFFPDAERWKNDVPRLKSRYRTASHGLIALRLLDRPIPTIVTFFDQGCMSCRKTNLPATRPDLFPAETEALQRVQSERSPLSIEADFGRLDLWPIDEPGRRREILVTQFSEAALLVEG